MKLSKTSYVLTSIVFCCMLSPFASAQTMIATNGKSTYSIVIPAKAPRSVQDAAIEFQKDVKIATGPKLLIQKDDAKVSGDYISLGSTKQAKAAGISSEKMTEESYRIVTKEGNLYIIGPDTPDGGWTKNNGTSDGTANGVYSFLEDYLNVRWLMPGALGREVPPISTFTLKDIDRTFTPKFSRRKLTHLTYYSNASQHPHIKAWMSRQKLGGASDLYFMHNWWRTINEAFGGRRTANVDTAAVKKAYQEHPDWFAMNRNGKRPLPKNHYAKLETTNQDLVKWYAEYAIKSMKESKRPNTYSLSPSDGAGWSLSPKSVALYEQNPNKSYDPEDPQKSASMSSLVAKWYHDVAKIVAEEYPQGRVSGFLYSSFVYPPKKVTAKLPSNFTPQIAPGGTSGYALYRDDSQKYFRTVTGEWAKLITGDWYYYGLPALLLRQDKSTVGRSAGYSDFPGGSGVVTPASPELANIVFSQLLKSHINGAEIYGDPSWGNGALHNYVWAKMEWDPTLNAHDLQTEWLHHAYGDKAGAVMDKFYIQLDGWFRDYSLQHEKMGYELTLQILKDLYGTHYPEMEKLFLQAKDQPMTKLQQERFQIMEDNMIVLQWRLRNMHALPDNFASPLQRSDAQISDLIGHDSPNFPLFAGITNAERYQSSLTPLPWKVRFTNSPSSANKSTLPKWDDNQFLFYAAKDEDVRITTQMVANGAYFAAYNVKDEKGNTITSGIFNTEKPLVFSAKAGQAYMLTIPLRKPANFQVQVPGAAIANGNLQDGTLQLSSKQSASVYVFYVPGKKPVGVFQDDDGVNIRKPYSGTVAKGYMNGSAWDSAHLLYSFDDGWKFSPDPKDNGEERGVTKLGFDDSSWKPISPLNWWQYQGFPDYHGAGWYRLTFKGKSMKEGDTAVLFFGSVDGDAMVYLNGKKLGGHKIGPAPTYKGWNTAFAKHITRYMKPGENILAVKVTSKSDTTASGIFGGVVVVAGKHK